MDARPLTHAIKARARELGFDAVGVTPLHASDHATVLREWLDAGRHGDIVASALVALDNPSAAQEGRRWMWPWTRWSCRRPWIGVCLLWRHPWSRRARSCSRGRTAMRTSNRCGYAGFKRNVAVAVGNWLVSVDEPPQEALAVLRNALEDEEPLVQEHAAWALERVGGSDAVR